MKRTYRYAAMTKDEAQRSRWTFYEAVNNWHDMCSLEEHLLRA